MTLGAAAAAVGTCSLRGPSYDGVTPTAAQPYFDDDSAPWADALRGRAGFGLYGARSVLRHVDALRAASESFD